MTTRGDEQRIASGRALRAALWVPGLAVGVGAAVATAHGLFEVALAARVPAAVGWLYPLITDGLALVAYAATARLHGSAARYAWAVVVLAAGLSGLAQASYLASDTTLEAAPPLRFGVGAWPAIAAAIVAHLLYLLATAPDHTAVHDAGRPTENASGPVQAVPFTRTSSEPDQAVNTPSEGERAALPAPAVQHSPVQPDRADRDTPVRARTRAAATRYAARHGQLPTVTELQALAGVSRGTAARVLKALRAQPLPLHLITSQAAEPAPAESDSSEDHRLP